MNTSNASKLARAAHEKASVSRRRRLRKSANKRKLWSAACYVHDPFLQSWAPFAQSIFPDLRYWQSEAEISCGAQTPVTKSVAGTNFHDGESSSKRDLGIMETDTVEGIALLVRVQTGVAEVLSTLDMLQDGLCEKLYCRKVLAGLIQDFGEEHVKDLE